MRLGLKDISEFLLHFTYLQFPVVCSERKFTAAIKFYSKYKKFCNFLQYGNPDTNSDNLEDIKITSSAPFTHLDSSESSHKYKHIINYYDKKSF
jgi:hypothetical protein